MEKIENKNYKILTPFKGWVLQNFPFIEADFDALTNYELICKITEYLNTVIYNQREVQDLSVELVKGYNDLLDYVNKYFDNLDVQEEINNKLDQMAESGELTLIISSYINPYIETQNETINNFKDLVNSEISTINAKVDSTASGSPKGVYATVSALTSADPSHDYIYVVTDDGKWYYYNSSSSQWTAGGQYQVANYPEITDIRTAYNDFTYASAGDSVRSQVSDVNNILNQGFYYDRTYTEYNGSSQGVSSGLYYINTSGNVVENNTYLTYSMQVESDCYCYPSVSSSYKTIAIFNSSTFSSSTLVKLITSDNFPTIEEPVALQSGWYIAVTGRNNPVITINLSTQYELKLNDIKSIQQYDYINGAEFTNDVILSAANGIPGNQSDDDITYSRHPRILKNPIRVFNGQHFKWIIKQNAHEEQQYIRICYYDENQNFISTEAYNLTLQLYDDKYVATKNFTVNNSSIKYMNICFRSYNEEGIDYKLYTDFNIDNINNIVTNMEYNKQDSKKAIYPFDNLFPLSIAHAGDKANAPENTLPAFRLAKTKGWTFVETDLNFTSDNVCVLLHDKTINRTGRNTDGTIISETININDITYEQALTYDFGIYKSSIYAGVKICTLEELLQLCVELNLYAMLEIKTSYFTSNTQYEIVYNLLKKYNMLDKVIFTTSTVTNLMPLLYMDNKLCVGISRTENDSNLSKKPYGFQLKTPNNKVFIGYNFDSLTSDSITNCLNNDLEPGYWVATTEEEMLNLPKSMRFVTSENYSYNKVLYDNNIGDPDTGLLN